MTITHRCLQDAQENTVQQQAEEAATAGEEGEKEAKRCVFVVLLRLSWCVFNR
jgi:hypothetical protein